MDKFGILAVRNAWYDPSKVTDHVIQGYTKVTYMSLKILQLSDPYAKTENYVFSSAIKIQRLGDGSFGVHYIHDHGFYIIIESACLRKAF
jgi:hypothetical protein